MRGLHTIGTDHRSHCEQWFSRAFLNIKERNLVKVSYLHRRSIAKYCSNEVRYLKSILSSSRARKVSKNLTTLETNFFFASLHVDDMSVFLRMNK